MPQQVGDVLCVGPPGRGVGSAAMHQQPVTLSGGVTVTVTTTVTVEVLDHTQCEAVVALWRTTATPAGAFKCFES